MADEEDLADEVEEPVDEELDEEELDDEELDDELDDEVLGDELLTDDPVAVIEGADEDEAEVVVPDVPKKRAKGDDDDEDEDEEDDEDDVEEDLDTILKDRIAAVPEEEDDDEDAPVEVEDRSEGGGRVQPKRPGEFVCQSCFLVKHPGQLADADAMLCADCV